MGMIHSRTGTPRRALRKSAPPQRTSLADALFTTTQQRLLGLIYGQPQRTFFANELIALTGSGSGAVQRELARLLESGLVTSRVMGRQRHYQANAGAPIFEELRNIVMKTVGAAEPLRAALEPLRDRISLAFVYGSVARGTDTAASDIDLLVVADRLMLEGLYSALEPVERRLGRKVSPRLLTSAEFERRLKASNPFLTRVLSGPRIVLVGDDSVDRAAR